MGKAGQAERWLKPSLPVHVFLCTPCLSGGRTLRTAALHSRITFAKPFFRGPCLRALADGRRKSGLDSFRAECPSRRRNDVFVFRQPAVLSCFLPQPGQNAKPAAFATRLWRFRERACSPFAKPSRPHPIRAQNKASKFTSMDAPLSPLRLRRSRSPGLRYSAAASRLSVSKMMLETLQGQLPHCFLGCVFPETTKNCGEVAGFHWKPLQHASMVKQMQ